MIALRTDYKNVTPPHTTSDGSDIKLTGVSYKSIIDNNNPNNYTIDWAKFNTDTQSLLGQVDYDIEEVLSLEEENKREFQLETIIETSQPNTTLIIWFGIALIFGSALTYFILKRRSLRKK
ncbi:MAG: hypothetical protein GQ574_21105 [Crocinitomix sp.]|nr:hypothetical protein [Crocinitomix sp.]